MTKNVLNCQAKKQNKTKIGIMGGTFDPIHIGHLILAEHAYEQLELDHVLVMPSGNPPHKQNRAGRASDEQRLEMTRLAIADNPHLKLSLLDMRKNEYSYTYHLLQQLHADNPDTEYYFIIGADSLFSFDTWMEPAKICKECILAVATRDHASREALSAQIHYLSDKYGARFVILDTPNIDISSNEIRAWAYHNKSIRYYVPDSVAQYIHKNAVYDDLES